MTYPPVVAFIPSTLVDWDGRIASVLVLQGCNCRCPFCHSSKFVHPGPPEDEVPWDAVERHITSNEGWIDGVVVSGGEPTIHAGLAGLLASLRDLGVPVKLDTNGSAPARLRELVEAGLVEHVAMDVKAPLGAEPYARATGVAPESAARLVAGVRQSTEYLRTGAVSYELRTTVAPGIFAEEADLDGLAAELSWARRWYLQGFRPVDCLDPAMQRCPATDAGWLERTAERLRAVAPGCRARGAGAGRDVRDHGRPVSR